MLSADREVACGRRVRLGGVLDGWASRSLGLSWALGGRFSVRGLGGWCLSLDRLNRLPLDLLNGLPLDLLNRLALDLLNRLPMRGLRNRRASVDTTLVFAQRGLLDVFRTARLAAERLVHW